MLCIRDGKTTIFLASAYTPPPQEEEELNPIGVNNLYSY